MINILILFMGVIFASTSSAFVNIANAPSMILVLYRLVLTCAILLPIFLIKNRQELKSLEKKSLMPVVLAGLSFALHLATYFEALRLTAIADVVVMVSSEVIFVAIIERIFFKQKISSLGWMLLIVAIIGGYIVVQGGDKSIGSNPMMGSLLGITAALFSALYTIFGKQARKTVSTSFYTLAVYLISIVIMIVLSLFKGDSLVGYDSINWLSALGLAIFPTLLGHNIFSYSLKHIKASMVSAAKLMMPVFATIIAFFAFGQKPTARAIIGSLIMISALAAYIFIYNKEQAKQEQLNK